MTMAEAVEDALPPDNEMIMSKVIAGNPLTVDIRGASVELGRLSTGAFSVGDPVAVLREGATYLALGKVIGSTGTGLGLTQLRMSVCNATLSLTAVEQDVSGTAIAFTTTSPAAQVLAVWFADYEAIAANTTTGSTMLRIDNVTAVSPAALFRGLANTERGTVGQASLVGVGPGNHTAILRALRATGADATLQVRSLHTTLLIGVFE